MKQKIKKNSLVKVISGSNKGREGKVLAINLKKSLVKVEGIALVTRHYKAQQQNEKSEKRVFERFIHISNVALVLAS